MADGSYRLWNLSDKELIPHFNAKYPQVRSWKLAALRPRMHSALISSLCKRISTKGLFPLEPEHMNAASGNGKSSAGRTTWTPSLIKYGTRSRFSNFLPAGLEAAYSFTTGIQYAHVLLMRTSGRLGRSLPMWVSGTPPEQEREHRPPSPTTGTRVNKIRWAPEAAQTH